MKTTAVWGWVVVGLVHSALVSAQTLRDPTQGPLQAVVPQGGGTAPNPEAGKADPPGKAMLIRDGVAYLMIGTRLYGVGQRVGRARIERITETEVWLREDGVLRKLTQFAGVRRLESLAAQTPCSGSLEATSSATRVKPGLTPACPLVLR